MFIHSSVENSAVDICVQDYMWTHVFISLGYIPRSGIAGSYGNTTFNALRTCWIVFQRGCTHFVILSIIDEGSNLSTSFLMLLIFCLFNFSHLVCCALLSRSIMSQLFTTPWTGSVACQASLSMGILQAGTLEGLPCPSPGDLPNPGLPHCRPILYCLSHEGSR